MPFKPRSANGPLAEAAAPAPSSDDASAPSAAVADATPASSDASSSPSAVSTPAADASPATPAPSEAQPASQIKPFKRPVLVPEASQEQAAQSNAGAPKPFSPPKLVPEPTAAPGPSEAAVANTTSVAPEPQQQTQVKRFAPPKLVSEPSASAVTAPPAPADSSSTASANTTSEQPKVKPFSPPRLGNNDASVAPAAAPVPTPAAQEVQPQIRRFEPRQAGGASAAAAPVPPNPEPAIRAFSPPKLGGNAAPPASAATSAPAPSGAFIRPFAPPKISAAPAAPVDNRDEKAKLLEKFCSTFSSGDVLLDCDMCEKARSVVHCVPCSSSFCGACDTKIHSLKNKCDHVRTDIKPAPSASGNNCPYHKSSALDQYCKQCDTIICTSCKDFGLHRDHKVEPLNVLLAQKKEALDAKVETLAQSIRHVESVLLKVNGHMAKLALGPNGEPSEAEAAAIAEVETNFAEITRQVNERREKLLSEIDEVAATKLGTIKSQIATLQDTIQRGNSLAAMCKLVEDPSATFTPDALAVILKSASSFVSQAKARKTDLEFPVTDTFIGVSFSNLTKKRIASYGYVGGPDNLQFYVDDKTGQCTVRWSPPVAKRAGVSVVCYNCDAVVVKTALDGTNKVSFIGQGDVFPDGDNDLKFVVNVRPYAGSKIGFRLRCVYSDKSLSDWCVTDEPVVLASRYLEKKCEMKSHFDKNGVLFHIGCRGGKKVYNNPHNDGEVMVAWSSVGDGTVDTFVAHEYSGAFSYTTNAPNSWMSVDVGRQRAVILRGYCLRHDALGPRGVLRNWVLQGRNDPPQRVGGGFSVPLAPPSEADWVTLSEHKNDESLRPQAGSTAYFAIEPSAKTDTPYRYFRVLQTGPNSSGKFRMSCAGIELYGDLS